MAEGPTLSAAPPASRPFRESLLVLSDVHLGRALCGPASADEKRRQGPVEADLVRLIAHYRRTPPGADRWRLVLAGDFIDFIGMTLDAADAPVETEPTEEEREHGLGNAADHARIKAQRVTRHHRRVFRALAEFVLDGHALSFVHGNHDVELHWDDVQQELRAALLGHAIDADESVDGADFLARIEFHPWFFYVDGVAYIEHGHQYDAFCASENIMAPVSPLDPRRLARGFSDTLIRFVVRPTRGIPEHGHENLGVADYVGFGLRLGVKGTFTLATRFAQAVIELFRLRRVYLGEAAKALHAEHVRRVRLLGEVTRIGQARLEALLALQTPPVTSSIGGILGSVLLDRIALAMGAAIALIIVAILSFRNGHVGWAALAVLSAWSLAHRHLARNRHVDPRETLAERAGHLAKLFPAAFVVMGHTHVPVKTPINEGTSTYVNLGAWADDDDDIADDAPAEQRAPRTHLVIRVGPSGPVGELLRWTGAPEHFATIQPGPVEPS
jgi:UDP-2,3-diacylglucosamine pyrophosphatase LpxH